VRKCLRPRAPGAELKKAELKLCFLFFILKDKKFSSSGLVRFFWIFWEDLDTAFCRAKIKSEGVRDLDKTGFPRGQRDLIKEV